MTTREDLKPIRVRQSVFDAVRDWKTRQQAAAGNGLERSTYPSAESSCAVFHAVSSLSLPMNASCGFPMWNRCLSKIHLRKVCGACSRGWG